MERGEGERNFAEFLKLARATLLLKQKNIGNVDVDTNNELLVSYRGFLMGLKVILDYISSSNN